MQALWEQLHDHFDTDYGSLPDIFIEELSGSQVCLIYRWVRSQCVIYCEQGMPVYWDRYEERDVPIQSADDPSELVVAGRADPFRHGLSRLSVAGVELPQLTIAVFLDSIHFDYRMGSDWGPPQLCALFDFLWSIQQIAPAAKICHAHEGASQATGSFTNAWEEYKHFRERSESGSA